MTAFENRDQWFESYQQGWLKHFQETGQFDWKIYQRPKNTTPISGAAIDLSQSRLALISTAGAYLKDEQTPFDAPHPIGDYSIRTFPSSTAFDQLDYAHTHYDQTAVRTDAQVLLPLRHLENMVREGYIGELAPSVISYMGYQPDATRTMDETFPAILERLKQERVQAALLVPA
jgi:D-proline reductase (dithiol) PrdB